jgi:hypothetical protein
LLCSLVHTILHFFASRSYGWSMSGSVSSNCARITSSLRIVNSVVQLQTAANGTTAQFANITDVGATFFAPVEACSILRWVATRESERWLARLLSRALAGPLAEDEADHPVMLDIGANAGYFGLLAAGLGANVIFFEPQPACHLWIKSAVHANNFGRHAHLVRAALGVEPPIGQAARLFLGKEGTNMKGIGCAGGFNIAGRVNQSLEVEAGKDLFADVYSFWDGDRNWMPTALHGVVQGKHTIRFVKMDVNGAEVGVIRHNLLPLLRSRRIAHFFSEFNVGDQAKFHPKGTSAADVDLTSARLVNEIVSFGYRASSLRLRGRKINESNSSEAFWKAYFASMPWPKAEDLHFERE